MKKRFLLLALILTIPLISLLRPVSSQNSNEFYTRANTLLISGKYDDAIIMYNQAIRQNSKFADAYMGLGMAYKAQGMYNESYNATLKSLSLKPNYYQAYYNLGLILENLNRPEEAIVAYEKFLKEVPGADRFSDAKQRISILRKH